MKQKKLFKNFKFKIQTLSIAACRDASQKSCSALPSRGRVNHIHTRRIKLGGGGSPELNII